MRVLVLSPRIASGLLTSEAWTALRDADVVRAPDLDDPHVAAIVHSGINVIGGSGAPTYAADTVWIAPTGDAAWAQQVATDLMGDESQHVEVIVGSYELPGSGVLDLVDVMDQLRRRCPWTQAQTHASLSHYLLEETHETLDALDSGDSELLREELGDLLMQVVFHARIAAESEEWSLDDVAEDIVAKLVYRNPHVFGDETVSSADEVDARWQALKAIEKPRASPLDGIAVTLPALAVADKVLGRMEPGSKPDPGAGNPEASTIDIGERLLDVVRDARAEGVNAEEALRKTIRKLVDG